MTAASRLTDCLLKNLRKFDMPLSSECAKLAHFASTYVWYGCCGGLNTTSQDGIGSDLSQKDCVLFDCCCQYLELLLLGQKEASDMPKRLAIVLKSFRKPFTLSRWKVVIAGVKHVLQSTVSCMHAEPDHRLSLGCCLTEAVAIFVSFLISFQNCEVAVSTVKDLLSSLESSFLSDSVAPSDIGGLKLIASMLLAFVKATRFVKQSKECVSSGLENVEQLCSVLSDNLKEFELTVAKIQPVTARTVIASVESLVNLLLGHRDKNVLPVEGLHVVISLYTRQLALCETVISQRMSSDNGELSRILCLKRVMSFRKLKLIHDHVQRDCDTITGVYVLQG